jgi:hypothetical protein
MSLVTGFESFRATLSVVACPERRRTGPWLAVALAKAASAFVIRPSPFDISAAPIRLHWKIQQSSDKKAFPHASP